MTILCSTRLSKPEPYWNSKTTYSLLFPVNEDFLKNKGKDFGKSTDPTSILYNGPFLLKSLTAKSSIELVKNEHYWDKKMYTLMPSNSHIMMVRIKML